MKNNNDYQIQNLLKILEKKLLKINFEFKSKKQNLDIDTFLEIIAHVYINYSKKFYSFLLKNGFSLYSLNDYKLVENIILIQTKLFVKKPNLTINQFFNHGYLKHKIHFCIESIDCLRNWLKKNNINEKEYKKKNQMKDKKNKKEKKITKEKFAIKNNLYSGLNLENLKKEKLEEDINEDSNNNIKEDINEDFNNNSKEEILNKNENKQDFRNNIKNNFKEEIYDKKLKNKDFEKVDNIKKSKRKNNSLNKNNKILINLILETNKNLSLLSENFKNTTTRLEDKIMNLEAKIILLEKKSLIKK